MTNQATLPLVKSIACNTCRSTVFYLAEVTPVLIYIQCGNPLCYEMQPAIVYRSQVTHLLCNVLNTTEDKLSTFINRKIDLTIKDERTFIKYADTGVNVPFNVFVEMQRLTELEAKDKQLQNVIADSVILSESTTENDTLDSLLCDIANLTNYQGNELAVI